MASTIDHIETLISKAGDLAETKVELWKLKTTSRVSETLSSLISKIALVLLAGVALLLLSFGAAFWIGSALENVYMGFFIVGGFYLILGLIIYALRNVLIKTPISNLIIDKFTK